MGSTKFEGGSLQEVLQVKSNQTTPNPKIRIIQMIIQCYKVYKITRYTRDVQDTQMDTRYTKEINDSHPRAKHAPSGTYSTWTAFTGN
jgi:hypothetical protein